MANAGKGHLFGDALFNADFFQLQNTEGEEIIKYTKEGGLEIPGGGGGGGAKIFLQAEEPETWDVGDWWYEILTDDSRDDTPDQ